MSHDTEREHARPAGHAGGPGQTAPANGAASLELVLKRETSSPRAAASVIAAVLVIALCVYALLETAVRAVGQPPWLVDPQAAAEQIVALPDGVSPLLLGVTGAVLAMLGLFFFLNAVLPGRRARHVLWDRRAAVVVDDEVIASALARRARAAANVSQEQVMVIVSRQLVVVNVRPTSGMPLAEGAVLRAVQDELRDMGPTPMPEIRINISVAGVIGA